MTITPIPVGLLGGFGGLNNSKQLQGALRVGSKTFARNSNVQIRRSELWSRGTLGYIHIYIYYETPC